MTLPPLTVIEASAGTGKTFSLVTRLLRLIFGGTEPERIVALTFSRLAAGEIFNSFIERLAKAAADPKVAAAEAERMGRDLGVADFAEKLRLVIARQHLSLIGTLDSFLMRVVRMIPLELGLEGEVTVMSDYQSPVERMRLVGEMLMLESDDAKEVFREAFRLAFGTVGAKGFLGSFSEFIDRWHTRYRDNGDAAAWGCPETIWGAEAPADLDVSLADVRALAGPLGKFAGQRGADKFIAAVADFHGTLPDTLRPKCMEGDPVFEEALRKMLAWKVGRELKATQGVYRLMRVYEGSYRVKVRQKGRITFEDMPRLLNALGDGVRLPLEYRMDAQFDHWALDEFQDTSRDQWKAIRNLIYESSQPDLGKSVFIVGDRKQSIYEWRGGDVRILGEQVREAERDGNRAETLDESRRYVGEISRAVNAVFGEVQVRGAFDMDDAPESAVWRCREHRSFDKATQGYVEVIQAEKARKQATIADFFEPIVHALRAVEPWKRGIATAILVRKNDAGEAILAHLKAQGVDQVVFEGDSKVSDSPVLSAMTELVKLAEHAGDEYAYAHIRLSPLGAALYPDGELDFLNNCGCTVDANGDFEAKAWLLDKEKFTDGGEFCFRIMDSNWSKVYAERRFTRAMTVSNKKIVAKANADFAKFVGKNVRAVITADGVKVPENTRVPFATKWNPSDGGKTVWKQPFWRDLFPSGDFKGASVTNSIPIEIPADAKDIGFSLGDLKDPAQIIYTEIKFEEVK